MKIANPHRLIFTAALSLAIFALLALRSEVLHYLTNVVPSAYATGDRPDDCGQKTQYHTDEDDLLPLNFSATGQRVMIEFVGENDDRDQVIVTAGTGYEIVSLRYETETPNGWVDVSVNNPITTINLAGDSDATRIDEVEVEVAKNCDTPPVDVCPNIDGAQESVPEGMIQDENKNCVADPGDPVTPPEVVTPTPTPTCNPGSSLINGVCSHSQPQNGLGITPPGQNSATSGSAASGGNVQGQILGASTLANTGTLSADLLNFSGLLGSYFISLGFRKKSR